VWLVQNNSGYRALCREFERISGLRLLVALNTRGMDPQKILCGIAGGDPPDVLYQDRFAVGGFAARGAFMPLDDYITGSELGWDSFYEGTRAEATYGEHIYAVPWACDNRALYYNRDLLRRASLVDENGDPLPPRDWDELKQYAIDLTEQEDERYTRIGFDPNFGNVWLYMYSWQAGGELVSPDGARCTLDAPENIRALEFMTELYDAVGGREAVMKFSSTFEANENDPFFAGKVAMKTDGNWVLEQISRYAPNLDFGVAPAPMPNRNDPVISWSGGFAWVIPAGAKKPDDAWRFIEFCVSDAGQRLYHEAQSRETQARGQPYVPSFSARQDVNEGYLYETYIKDNRDLSPNIRRGYLQFIELLPVSRYRPVTPVGQLLWDEHVRAYEQATLHRMSAQAALELGQARVQKELDLLLKTKAPPPLRWTGPIVATLGLLGILVALAITRLRRQGIRYDRNETVAGLLFAAPWFIGFLVFVAGPIIVSLVLSFCEYDVLHEPKYVGLDNYSSLLSVEVVREVDPLTETEHLALKPNEPTFWKSLFNTLFMVLGVPIGMAVGLAIAMLLNAKVGGLSVYRTIYYLPAIVPIVAASILWIWVLNPENGLLNNLIEPLFSPTVVGVSLQVAIGLVLLAVAIAKRRALASLGIAQRVVALAVLHLCLWITWRYLANPVDGLVTTRLLAPLYTAPMPGWLTTDNLWTGSKMAIIVMGLWGAGASMIIWLAGLKGIPQHLYEAAMIDGAGPWGRFRNVTIPQLSPYIFFNLVMGIIGTFQIFDQAYVMTEGGPADSTLFYVYSLFKNAFQYFKMGVASAQAWILFIIILVLTLIQLKLAPRWVHYESE